MMLELNRIAKKTALHDRAVIRGQEIFLRHVRGLLS